MGRRNTLKASEEEVYLMEGKGRKSMGARPVGGYGCHN